MSGEALETDVVVVGSGATGAVVAATLAEAGQRVVVLEEGPRVAPAKYGAMRPSQSLRALWREAGMSFAIGVGDSPVINVMMGRCVGGSSVLTGGVCFRLPEHVLHRWRTERGLTALEPRELEACFEDVERRVGVKEVPAALRSRSAELFGEGARKLGVTLKPLRRNTEGCRGMGRCNFGCPHGAKLSVDVSYLPRALAAGAQLRTECLVKRVLHEGGRAVGVEARTSRGRLRVRARRVVLAAGAYHTPLLLLASGLGRDSGQVGRNLTLHPSFRVMARFDEPVEGWRGALQSTFSDDLEAEGITLVNLFVPPGVLAATLPGIGPAHLRNAATIPHLAVFGGLVHDEGGGRVRRGLGREPWVTYRMAARDKAVVPRLMRTMAEIYFAAGAKEVFLPVLGLPAVTPDALRALPLEQISGRQLECSSQHPLGTCRMGTQPGSSVVGPDHECWELKELFIADGSVVPTSLGVNPQLTLMALATRLAWRLRERPLPA